MNFERLKNDFLLFKTMFWKEKWRMLLLTGLGFFSGVLDSVGIGALIPLFAIVAKDSSSKANRISDLVGTLFAYFGLNLNLHTILLFMSLIFLTKAVTEFITGYIRIRIITQFQVDKRNDLYMKTLMARWPYLMRQKIGHLENILMTDINATQGLLNRLCFVAPSMASFIVYLLIAIKVSFPITAITLGIGMVILIFTKPVSRRLKKYTNVITRTNKEVAHHVNENVQGMKMVKALGIERDVADAEVGVFGQLQRLIIKSAMVKQLGTGFMEPIMFIFISLVFAYSYSQPGFSIGGFVVVMYLIQRIFNSVDKIQGSFLSISESIPYMYQVIGLDRATTENREQDNGSALFSFKKDLEFRNVTFGYRQDTPVLQHVSFTVKENEMVGVIGPSGAGKTTIADLLLRLFEPLTGEILIDGKNISLIKLNELRTHVGYVSQDIFLKNDTVENNIRFYAKNISEAEIVAAAKMANIYDFIKELPSGFQTIIGDRGILLSGGQRQRIVLARTLARKPKILILDEATSALDNESELLIRQSIESLKGGVTVIIIAHRLSTIMNCDRLIALDNGAIIEQGTPAELLEDPASYFYRVHHLQEEK